MDLHYQIPDQIILKEENKLKANYRKYNDGSLSSSTYHKKDGTNVRAIFKDQLVKELKKLDYKIR